jgi:hypothetical protein
VTDTHVPAELRPYFEVCFILGFGLCSLCGCEQPFSSDHPQFSDGWWLDEARAMHAAGWSVPKLQTALCAVCSRDASAGRR